MRVLNVAILLALASGMAVRAQTISTTEASPHVGQHATVCGEIAGEHTATSSRGTPHLSISTSPTRTRSSRS